MIEQHRRRRRILLLGILLFIQQVSLFGATDEKPPISLLVQEWNELGQTILRWHADDRNPRTWLFGAVGLFALQAGPSGEDPPFPVVQRILPPLWPDVKDLKNKDLYEIADGILYQTGDMVAWQPGVAFGQLSSEKQALACLTGMRHLSMLEASIGPTTFWAVLRESVNRCIYAPVLTDTLIQVLAEHTSTTLAGHFAQALASPDRTDIELREVRHQGDWYTLDIRQRGAWSFPFDIDAITSEGDTLCFRQVELVGNQFRFLSIRPIRRIELDPHHDLVEIYRFNNHWPRLRGNLVVQPFFTLPNWEEFSISVNPSSWKDWGQETRYGIKLSGGFGIDLMPAYPSDYRHRFSLEANSYGPVDEVESWGLSATYAHPLSWSRRLFLESEGITYRDWQGLRMTFTLYPGLQRYFIQGPDIRFRRLTMTAGVDAYDNAAVWGYSQRLRFLGLGYYTLALTRSGNRVKADVRGVRGRSSEVELVDRFWILRGNVELAGVLMNWLTGDLRMVAGIQSLNIPPPYRFSHDHYWNSSLAWLPRFQGQPLYTDPVNRYLGLSFSTGFWVKWIQIKGFASSLLFNDGQVPLTRVQPRYALGFGLEHKSFFTAGMYFPIWQSHPLPGEEQLAWRTEWRFEWNL